MTQTMAACRTKTFDTSGSVIGLASRTLRWAVGFLEKKSTLFSQTDAVYAAILVS